MKQIYIYVTALVALLFVSCTSEPEVLEFDPSYKTKEVEKLNRETLPVAPIDVLTKYVYFGADNGSIYVDRVLNDNDAIEEVLPIENYEVSIKLSRVLEEDAKVTLSVMSAMSHPELFREIVIGLTKVLPSDCFTLPENPLITIPVGKKSATTALSFNLEALKNLTVDGDYIIPLVLSSTQSDLVVANYLLLKVIINDASEIPDEDDME